MLQTKPATSSQNNNNFNQLQQHQQLTLDNPQIQQMSRNYGNNIILRRDSNGQPTLVLGPHWYIFVFAFLTTITLFVLLLYTMRENILGIWYYALIAIGVIYAYSYLRVGLSNPGFAQPTNAIPHSDVRICDICRVIKTREIYHCSDCNVCIQGFDHHCPWVGKCIGANNLNSFYFFLVMIFGTLIFCFIATIVSAKPSAGPGNLTVAH